MTSFAFLRAHAFSVGVLQESILTETADDTLESTKFRWFGICAIRRAGGSAIEKFGVGAAFFINWKSRFGDSEPEGTNAEQQHGNKAKGHRLKKLLTVTGMRKK